MALLDSEQQQMVRLLRWIALFTGILAAFVVVCSALFVWTCAEGINSVAEALRGPAGN
jgi:low affinity Fe/Cu permease